MNLIGTRKDQLRGGSKTTIQTNYDMMARQWLRKKNSIGQTTHC